MKTSKNLSGNGNNHPARRVSNIYAVAALVIFIAISWHLSIGHAQPADGDEVGATVLTRGPVHEAFAGIVTFDPEPGVVVSKAPPEVIEELPPEERPEGDNVTWIPGYWAWDDERTDYLWVSGTWRALPPGRAWMAGYWAKSSSGFQWTSGYWADAAEKETTYLPAPPATVEVGPNTEAPSDDYGWTPGYWAWYQGRYAWSPGYWVLGRADWDWCPGHYVWTRRGYIYVGGFWDYPVERRGVIFAPVYFESSVYARRGYIYSPTIVIGLGVFSDHLFLRPRYGHYYFGDYYAPSYYQGGFYASFSFGYRHHGYDPIFSHQRWEHRRDRDWQRHVESSYENRRDHENARPPRTWAAQRNVNPDSAEARQNHTAIATPMDQLAKRKDGPMKFQPVAKAERQKLAQLGQEVQQSREQRRTLEAKGGDVAVRKTDATIEPTKVQLPRSPIVSKPNGKLGKDQTPPKAQMAPKPDSKPNRSGNKPEAPVRQPDAKRNNPQPESRASEPVIKPAPKQVETPTREPQIQPEPSPRQSQVTPAEKQAQPPARQPKPIETENGAGKDRQQIQPATRNSPPAAQPGRENPRVWDRLPPRAPDRDRERKNRD